MKLLLAAVLSLTPAAAFARAKADGGGRTIDFPNDEALAPLVRRWQALRPEVEYIETLSVQVPARVIDLSPNAPMYRCWKLRLTGDQGRQSAKVLERLRSIQSSVQKTKSSLARDLLDSISGNNSPEYLDGLRKRLEKYLGSLESLSVSFRRLSNTAQRNGLVRGVESGILNPNSALKPRLGKTDYTMVYDNSGPDCPSRPREP